MESFYNLIKTCVVDKIHSYKIEDANQPEAKKEFPKTISDFIKSNDSLESKVVCHDGNVLTIHTYRSSKCSVDALFEIIIQLMSIISFLTKNRNQKITATFYLTPLKKRFHSFPITPDQINSGYTSYISENVKHITIYREEELLKVWIHECLHAFNLTSWFPDENTISCIHSSYHSMHPYLKTNMQAHVLESEAYTEFMTQIIYFTLWSSGYDDFLKILSESIEYTEKQLTQLLYHANCGDGIRSNVESKCLWSEETASFGYIYLRLYLLRDPEFVFSYKTFDGMVTASDLHSIFKYLKKKYKLIQLNPAHKYKSNFSLRLTKPLSLYKSISSSSTIY